MDSMAGFNILTPDRIAKKEAKEISLLLSRLSGKVRELSRSQLLQETLNQNLFIVVKREDGKIVGMASVCFIAPLSHISAHIDDVVVDKPYRRRGIAKGLLNELISIARKRNVAYIELTSGPERTAANKMYLSMGFEMVAFAAEGGTNLFRLELGE